jgi:signal transduction histidine kinase
VIDTDSRPRDPPGSSAQPALSARLAKVLIVDDDERNAFAALQALDDLGCELVVARSGADALRRVLEDDFAVILLDLHMPGMDGYETAGLIRSRQRTRSVPIVFLTAVFREEAHLFQAYSAGAVDVVFKPVDPFILRSKVSVLVDLHVKTMEVTQQAERLQRLLDENLRVQAEKQSAQRALRDAQKRQQAILQSLPIVFHSRATSEPYPALFVSDSVRTVTGFEPRAFTEEPAFGLDRVHPEDRAKVVEALSGAAERGAYTCEYRWLCADGAYRVLLDQGIWSAGEDGGAPEIIGTILDATERRSLEEQLTQARKMEAVGQLTGGVAHDFNNLLTVVLGNIDMMSRRPNQDARLKRQIAAIRHASERGRGLTRQLLAFSRRQQLSPVALDIDALIQGFMPLMRQAVGDSVVVELALGGGGLFAYVDPVQLESALLNLAVNARDAMPQGGVLTISTQAVTDPHEPADRASWVQISLRDTGIGMHKDVVERVFEPFFTTKEVGLGSGLGLSQVYGFVSQSGGRVWVESQPGEGALFHLRLPRCAASTAERASSKEGPAPDHVGGSERLLIVEDDKEVLALTVEILAGLGYQVVTAGDASEALEHLHGAEPIDLMFSDVVMPGGTSGVQLAHLARSLRPDIRILLTSGYVGRPGQVGSEFPVLDKPYEPGALASRLRDLLSAGPAVPDLASARRDTKPARARSPRKVG